MADAAVIRNRRLTVLAVGAGVAFLAGAAFGAAHEPAEQRVAREFVAAWGRQDYPAMYERLSDSAKRRTTLQEFARAYLTSADTLTLERVRAGDASRSGDTTAVEVSMRTKIFGTLSGALELPVSEDEDGPGIDWDRHHVFPGLRAGGRVERTAELPPRADILARDGTPLARGRQRRSRLEPLAAGIVGEIGAPPPERADEVAARGLPEGSVIGLTGLEREFDVRLTGTPGGELRADGRLIARAPAREGEPVRTTIDPEIQRAAVDTLAGRFGGIAVMQPDTGEVLALAGVAYSAPQPPGSTFKIVTLAGALEAGIVEPRESFPVQTATRLDGVELQNANGESCGGSLTSSFAHSCNSVFGPMGAELGAERLVEYAEAFGFNEEPSLQGAAASTIPAAGEIGGDLAVGSSAIGQGRVLATALQMASVASTIANRGVRMRPTLQSGDRDDAGRSVSARTARRVRDMMRAAVTSGTGTAAAIPGVSVAGKTGTAELRSTQGEAAEPPPGEEAPPVDDTTDTDAWFAAFAPAKRPLVAVSVLLIGQGTGGDNAAPAARAVLIPALQRMRREARRSAPDG